MIPKRIGWESVTNTPSANMSPYERVQSGLLYEHKKWLVTGAAGFIGSNLVEKLLKLNQKVVGLDNFLTGHRHNLTEVESLVSPKTFKNFQLIQGDIRSLETCLAACEGTDYVLHQAALGSVPRSVKDPVATNENNLVGFLNMLVAAKKAEVKRFVYASSSSVYGDHPGLPKIEAKVGRPLSPYAVTKKVNELYASVFASVYGFQSIGLRYFNGFGPRQDQNGPYAAVIPKWFLALIRGRKVFIDGDGETSRDFCFVENIVQANILAACTDNPQALNQVYNVACGKQTTLNQLFSIIRSLVQRVNPSAAVALPVYRDFRPGDIRHSLANIYKAKRLLKYEPEHFVEDGLEKTSEWFFAGKRSFMTLHAKP